ncbi:DUF523 domain-containing protein [Roseibacterium sp. SDUM158016]|uniref:DUF523 domain-containing protein n=1 Tax=Roseicyclus sediminis TaxID=2980997 RepID=UPI0021D38B97|nr:DUF523 domain-containing protein [Roseibacterium sp. SDUM158016]MCU4654101.1 DUF523 domain-containing protein [Roseibacterium sp. SDUM158016]
MKRILVSACLLGQPVRYDGRAKGKGEGLLALWRAEGRLVPLCPEIAGGFSVPRAPAEIEPGASGAEVLTGGARILDTTGRDVTGGFLAGAEAAVALARKTGCAFALLTEGSPSCGVARIHAGHFDGTTRPGEGVVAAALRTAGVAVYGHDRAEELARRLAQVE